MKKINDIINEKATIYVVNNKEHSGFNEHYYQNGFNDADAMGFAEFIGKYGIGFHIFNLKPEWHCPAIEGFAPIIKTTEQLYELFLNRKEKDYDLR